MRIVDLYNKLLKSTKSKFEVVASVGPRAGPPRAGPGFFGPGRPGPLTLGPRPARPETGPGRLGPGRKKPDPSPARPEPEKPGPARGLFEFFYYFLKEFLTSSFHRNIKNQSFLVNLIIIFKKLCYFQNKLIFFCKKIS
jgi:hypothetical protein